MEHYIIYLLLISSTLCVNSLVVQTKNGLLRGTLMDIESGKSIKAFLGIPYAEAPIGDLRFRDPVAKQKWDDTKDATKIHPMCPQVDMITEGTKVEGSEDCLFLNIYTPKVVSEKLPVMVFIHGGAYFIGTAATPLYGPDLLLDKENVILVTMNYRLGALGFLSTGDDVVYGNMGLKDQAFALKWVKENIEDFGGDSNSVTIFGESAGASSVHLQMLSPLSRGLFHGAISQSGSALCVWAIQSLAKGAELTRKLASKLNCPTSSSKEMVECLRKADYKDIITNQMFYEWNKDPGLSLVPVVEINHPNAFIAKTPSEAIKSGDVADVPWLTGVNTEEGAMKYPEIHFSDEIAAAYDNEFEKIAKYSIFANKNIPNYENVVKKMKKFYFNGKSVKEATKSLIDMFTDSWFTSGADASVNLMRKHVKAPIYYYLFGYKGENSLLQTLGLKENVGVCHCDELQYLLKTLLIPTSKVKSEGDKKTTDIMTTLWTNFAKYKNPTPAGAQVGNVEWKPIQSNDNEYLYIGGSDNLKMKTNMFEERIQFWRDINILKLNYAKDEL